MLKKGRFVLGVAIVIMIIFAVKCEETINFHPEKRKENFGRAAKIIMNRTDVVIPMPQIVDIIIENDKCTALCEDGSVWEWEDLYEKRNLRKVNNLNFIVKIFDAGPAMYALSEDGHIYVWGSIEWHQIRIETEGEEEYFEDPIQLFNISNIIDMDVSFDADSGKAKGFCIDENGNFYEWGLYLYFDENEDYYLGFPQSKIDLVQGVATLAAGTGNYNYFIREDGSVFSIMETSIWEKSNVLDFIFPRLPVDENMRDVEKDPLKLEDFAYVDLREGTKYGVTILYNLGKDTGVERIESDPYTMFLYREDGTLWYWDSGAVQYHDDKNAMSNPEIYGEDYQGGFVEVDMKRILGIDNQDVHIPRIKDMCVGSNNVLFLTNDGQVFVSEYVTSESKDVEYYVLGNTNPNRSKTKRIENLQIKTIDFYKLDWENIASINTNGEYCFSAVDEKGDYFSLDMDPEKDNKDFYGIWHIDKVALCSEQYTGSIEDGDFEENLFDPADFIGMEIEYRKDYFRLGDKTYTNPEYILTNVEVKDVNEGGKFRNPNLYEFFLNEKIEIAGAEKGNYLSETLLTQVEVKFDDEIHYGDYNFIPVGTQIYVLNENAILIGIWGKILFAYRIK